jgi:hypothetical protein
MGTRVGRLAGAMTLAAILSLAGLGSLAASSPTFEPAVRCTPGYKPCIPLRKSDVDCRGGGGNGPRYTKAGVVYAVKRGMDRYRLDADRDGKGCERN